MIQVGCRAFHQNSRESFGEGIVLEVDERNDNALVEWRVTRDLPQTQSHVKLSSLVGVRR